MCILAHRAVADFKCTVETALPRGFQISDLPSNLTDDFSALPIHLQSENIPLLQKLTSDIWSGIISGTSGSSALFDKQGIVRIMADEWLTSYDNCFALAATVITITSGGIDPSSFKHQRYSGHKRTIFLLKNGIISLANPLSSRRKIGSRLDFICVPSDVSRNFLMLVTILLPIANHLRHLKGQINPLHSTHIWVEPRKRVNGSDRGLYDCNKVNAPLIVLTKDIFGIAITGKVICKAAYQLLGREFPLLFRNIMGLRSPVDDLAQHLHQTGLRNYGVLSIFPSMPNIPGDKAIRHLTFCEIWQAFIKCGPTNSLWKDLVMGSSLFPAQCFPGLAFQMARNLVLNAYGISKCQSSSERKNCIANAISSKPFLQGINVSPHVK